MKKKLLLFVLSSALLSGCEFNLESLKFWESKNTENSQENHGKNDEKEEENHEEEHHEEEHHEEEHHELDNLQEYTATLVTHGVYFNSNFPEGTNLNLGSQSKVDELREYLEDPLEYEDLFNTLTCDYCATRKVNGDTYLQIGTGSYAKGKFNVGTLTYGSQVKIYKVEVTAFNYSNPYQDYATGAHIPNVDTECHLLLDDVDLSLELPSDEDPVEKKVTKTYENGTNSFVLKATSGRVLIKEITITWRG